MIAVHAPAGARARAARLVPLALLALGLPLLGGCNKVQARAKFKEATPSTRKRSTGRRFIRSRRG